MHCPLNGLKPWVYDNFVSNYQKYVSVSTSGLRMEKLLGLQRCQSTSMMTKMTFNMWLVTWDLIVRVGSNKCWHWFVDWMLGCYNKNCMKLKQIFIKKYELKLVVVRSTKQLNSMHVRVLYITVSILWGQATFYLV